MQRMKGLTYLNQDLKRENSTENGYLDNEERNCAYLRKSRKDRDDELNGIDVLKRHKETLIKFADSLGKTIHKFYEEVVSAESLTEREEIKQLLSDVEMGAWDNVFTVEVERLARGNTREQGIVADTFKYSNTKILTPMKIYNPSDPNDEEYFEFGLFMSRREYKTINRRLMSGRLASVKEGKYVGSIAPFGYEKQKLKYEKGYTIVPHPIESSIVTFMCQTYETNDINMRQLGLLLDSLKMKPRHTEKWTVSAIKDILANPINMGIISWNRRKTVTKYIDGAINISRPRNRDNDIIYVKGIHEPLISEKTFINIQEKRKRFAVPVNIDRSLKNPFSGILYCEKCQKILTRKPYPGKDAGLICLSSGCDNVYSKFKYVEEKIIAGMKDILESYPLDNTKNNKFMNNEKSRLKNLVEIKETELIKEQGKLERIFNAYEDGTYTKEIFIVRKNNLDNSIKKIKKLLYDLKLQLKSIEMKSNEHLELLPKIDNVLKLYSSSEISIKKKNELLKGIVEKITYLKTEKSIKKNSDPYNFRIKIFLRVPKIFE